MYAAWLFFEDRFKDVYFPDLDNWTNQVFLSQFETNWNFDVTIPVRQLDGRMYFTLPDTFRWHDEHAAKEREVPANSYFKVIASNGSLINIIIKDIEKSQLCFVKYRLNRPNITIGRSDQADICDPDILLTSMHGSLTVRGSSIDYTDQSANGTYLNGRRLSRSTVRLQFGDVLTFPSGLKLVLLGDRFAVNRTGVIKHVKLDKCSPSKNPEPDAALPRLPSIYTQYHRAPRMLQKTDNSPIEIEPPIAKQGQNMQPLWLQLGPSFTMVLPMLMGTMLAGNRSGGMISSGIVMISTSSALAVMWGLINRKYRKKQADESESQRINMYRKYIQEMEQTLRELNDREYKRLVRTYPNVGQCAMLPTDSTRSLWDRMPTHSDFLNVRLGTGNVALPNPIQIQKQKLSIINDPLRDEPARLHHVYSTIADAPVTVNLRKEAVVGILGNAEAVMFAQGLLMQIASLHSYHDVRIAVLTDQPSASQWEWTRWLPHVFANEDREMRMVASKPAAIHDVMSHLDEVLMMRKNPDAAEDGEAEGETALPLPHYVIFCTSYRLLEDEPIMRRLLTNKLGMTLVMVAPSLELLPKESHLIINAGSKPGFLHTSEGDTTQVDFEYANHNLLTSFAHQIAPLRVRDAAENAAIPTLVSFLDIYGVRRVEDLDVWRMWTENHTYDGLRSTIGYSAGSRPFVLDISDKYHGPHGLIAGTTGSGKSVMLQTYILSLALNYGPNQVQFILIDYKGGGMADAFRSLPHVAGIIDNLQGERVINRALASLNGEIHRRERIFKLLNVNNINDYTRQYGDDPNEIKLPHLIIIVDEFAELKSEQPDFMRELVSASRVGRSLGIHLILATQKPSASVSDEIWANSRFHLCLRVQTRSDSMEMLKRPDAAYIKGMGRCFIQIGNDELFEQVQTSYSGLAYNPNEPRAEEMPHLLGDIGQAIRVPKRRKSTKDLVSGQKETTQMDAVLERISAVSGEHGLSHSKQLWLPEMRPQIYLGESRLFSNGVVRKGKYPNAPEGVSLMLGMADDVANQRYIPYIVNLTQMRNLMIVGLAGAGKTTAVQSMVYSLASQYDPEHLHMYILSLTSQSLGNLRQFPHVGDIAFENELIEIKRFINMLFEEEARRSELFAQASTDSFIEFNRSQRLRGKPEVPAIVVFIDRYEQIRTMFDNDDFYNTRIQALLREGSGRGIHFVVTALAKNEIPSKLYAFFSGIALQLRDRSDYSEVIGKRVPYDMPPVANYPGRGIALVDETPFEVQLALGGRGNLSPDMPGFASLNDYMSYALETAMPTPTPLTDVERAEMISNYARTLEALWKGKRPAKIPRIPEEPTYELFIEEPGFAEAQQTPYQLPIGYDMVKGSLTTIDLEKSFSWLVLGPKKSGRTNFLKFVARMFSARGADVHVVGDMNWRSLNGLPGFKLYTTNSEIIQFTHDFVKEYPGKRKPLHDAALARSKADGRKQALEFKPCVVIIDDADRINRDFKSEALVKEMQFMQNVYAQMASIASLYNIFLFMSTSFTERISLQFEPLKTLQAQGRGIVLGGKLNEFDPFGISSSMPLQSRSKALAAGYGYVVNGGAYMQIATPLAEQPEN